MVVCEETPLPTSLGWWIFRQIREALAGHVLPVAERGDRRVGDLGA